MKAKYRKGVFFVVYKKDGNKISYLVLKRKKHWLGWEFPKGGIEKNETGKDAVLRELREETGLKLKKFSDLSDIRGKFEYNEELADRPGIMGMGWKLFAIKVFFDDVKIDKKEHSSYKWLDFKQAYNILTWANQKRCLRAVSRMLG